MADGTVIRLLEFRTVGQAFDEVLRGELIPELCAHPGVIDCFCARQGPEEAGPRIVVSVWQTAAAMERALDDRPDPFHPDDLDGTVDHAVEVLPLRVAERWDVAGSERILRVLRGRVRPGDISLYEEDMRERPEAGTREHGPVAVYLAEAGTDRLVSVSTWRAWRDIEMETEGNIARPRATPHRDRLIDWTVNHFEIIGID